MRMLKHIPRLFILIGAISIFASDAFSQSKVGTTAAPFLTLGTGARASGLGHAYTAIATGPDALFWNPSGMAIDQSDNPNLGGLMFTNKQWFSGITYNALGFTLPVTDNNQVLGAHIIFMDYGNMDIRTVDQPDGTGQKFSAYDLSIGLSFASSLSEAFYIGGSTKFVQQGIYDMRAQTIAVDIGFTLITPYLNGLRLGASLMNFGGKMRMDGINAQFVTDPFPENRSSNDNVTSRFQLDEWNIPIQFKFGVMWPVVKQEMIEWQLMGESHQTNDQHLNADFGSQLLLKTRTTQLALRTGYKDFPLDTDFKIDDVDNHWTYGVGLQTGVNGLRFGVDFAYVPFDNLGDTTMLDLRIYF